MTVKRFIVGPPGCVYLCLICHKFYNPAKFSQKTCSAKCRNSLTAKTRSETWVIKQRQRGNNKAYKKQGDRHIHRIEAEKKIGRPLQAGEIVHHVDGNKFNNNPANLEVMTQSEHARIHFAEYRRLNNAAN